MSRDGRRRSGEGSTGRTLAFFLSPVAIVVLATIGAALVRAQRPAEPTAARPADGPGELSADESPESIAEESAEPDESRPPAASVWVKSSVVRSEEGELSLELDVSSVVVRRGGDEVEPGWSLAAQETSTHIRQTGDPVEAEQGLEGVVAYLSPTATQDFGVVGFVFTGEFEAGENGDRWWRLRECEVRTTDLSGEPTDGPRDGR